MHSKSDNIEIMINDEVDEVIKFFDSLENRYQNDLKSVKVVNLSLIMFICCILNVMK